MLFVSPSAALAFETIETSGKGTPYCRQRGEAP